jgi:hypothetical protein
MMVRLKSFKRCLSEHRSIAIEMAKMIPRIFSDKNRSIGEMRVFGALQKLPNAYTVFHSVSWNGRNERGLTHWGEADFTVLHRKYGMLVLEVKSGGIRYEDGEWHQTRTDNGDEFLINSPMAQAGRSKYRFINLINASLPLSQNCYVEQAVWFSSVNKHDQIGNLPIDYNGSNVLLENDLDTPEQSIERVFRFYKMHEMTKLDEIGANMIVNLLAPHYDAIPKMASLAKEREYEYFRMTEEQSRLLDYLEEQTVAAIQGCAGTGKTVLAVEKAKRLSADGDVLFLCFNRYLYEYLQESYADEHILFTNLHSLATSRLKIAVSDDADILEFLNHYDEYDWHFKHIVIDEGQDFDSSHVEMLNTIATLTGGSFYIFYDKNQIVQKEVLPDWISASECRLVLHRNCRNTIEIAKTSGKPLNIVPRLFAEGIEGAMPRFFACGNLERLKTAIADTIDSYLSEGFSIGQICLITIKTENASLYRDMDKIGRHKIVSSRSEKGLFFTTARKFKGLESDIVFVVDFDAMSLAVDGGMLFYVAASRAKHYLDIFCLGNSGELDAICKSIDPGFWGGNYKKKIATGLNVRPVIETEGSENLDG